MTADLIAEAREVWREACELAVRKDLAHASVFEAVWTARIASKALADALERAEKERDDALEVVSAFRAENERMRPYAVRGGYGADEEGLSEC